MWATLAGSTPCLTLSTESKKKDTYLNTETPQLKRGQPDIQTNQTRSDHRRTRNPTMRHAILIVGTRGACQWLPPYSVLDSISLYVTVYRATWVSLASTASISSRKTKAWCVHFQPPLVQGSESFILRYPDKCCTSVGNGTSWASASQAKNFLTVRPLSRRVEALRPLPRSSKLSALLSNSAPIGVSVPFSSEPKVFNPFASDLRLGALSVHRSTTVATSPGSEWVETVPQGEIGPQPTSAVQLRSSVVLLANTARQLTSCCSSSN